MKTLQIASPAPVNILINELENLGILRENIKKIPNQDEVIVFNVTEVQHTTLGRNELLINELNLVKF